MKKITIGSLLLLSVINTAYADTVGIYAGGGIWSTSMSGEIGETTDTVQPITADQLGVEDSENAFYYIALEHPIPIIPNIRLSHTSLSLEGRGQPDLDEIPALNPGDDSLAFLEGNYVVTDLDLTHTDATLYYEILDNYVSADLGITIRQLDGYAEIAVTDDDGTTVLTEQDAEFDGAIPMLYLKAQFDLPFTGWYLGGSGNFLSVGNNNDFTDLELKLGYLTDGLGLDFGFDLGYRQMKLSVDADDQAKADITIDGPYLSVNVHF